MPVQHASFCDLPPEGDVHGPMCVSAPIGREVRASTEEREQVDVTIDLAVDGPNPFRAAIVRLITEPPDIHMRTATAMTPDAARQLAAGLLRAAARADDLDD